MTSILETEARFFLGSLTSAKALFAFDFDGTLAPIVEDPDSAFMRPRTAELLAKLAEKHPCAVISGRKRADVLPRLSGIPLVAVVGNHGAEWEHGDDPQAALARSRMAAIRERIEQRVGSLAGVRIEDKGLSLALHLRSPATIEKVSALVLDALECLGDARIFGGKRVINVVLRDAPNKGTALRRLVFENAVDAALYVGDDVTDEDAFVDPGLSLFCPIRIGRSLESKASFFLNDQHEIDDLLALLVALTNR